MTIGNNQMAALREIASMAYGSGASEGVQGGAGRIGIMKGADGRDHVVKFNTHLGERLFGQRKSTDMVESCNALRTRLVELATQAGLGDDDVADIKARLGMDRGGKPTTLLDRKVVAKVVTMIGGDEVWAEQTRTDAKRSAEDMSFRTVSLRQILGTEALSADKIRKLEKKGLSQKDFHGVIDGVAKSRSMTVAQKEALTVRMAGYLFTNMLGEDPHGFSLAEEAKMKHKPLVETFKAFAERHAEIDQIGGLFTQSEKNRATAVNLCTKFDEWCRQQIEDWNAGLGKKGWAPIRENEMAGFRYLLLKEISQGPSFTDDPEAMFENHPLTAFASKGLLSEGRVVINLLSMPAEIRGKLYAIGSVLPEGLGSQGHVAPLVGRILRHLDELDGLRREDKLDAAALYRTVFGKEPPPTTVHTLDFENQLNAEYDTLIKKFDLKDPNLYAAVLALDRGATPDEVTSAFDRKENPPASQYFRDGSLPLKDFDGTVLGSVKQLKLDVGRPSGFAGVKAAYTFVFPEGEPIVSESSEANQEKQEAVFGNVVNRVCELCGGEHLEQEVAVLMQLTQAGPSMDIAAQLKQAGYGANEHCALTFTLVRDEATGDVTIHYSEPDGSPVKISADVTVGPDGSISRSEIKVVKKTNLTDIDVTACGSNEERRLKILLGRYTTRDLVTQHRQEFVDALAGFEGALDEVAKTLREDIATKVGADKLAAEEALQALEERLAEMRNAVAESPGFAEAHNAVCETSIEKMDFDQKWGPVYASAVSELEDSFLHLLRSDLYRSNSEAELRVSGMKMQMFAHLLGQDLNLLSVDSPGDLGEYAYAKALQDELKARLEEFKAAGKPFPLTNVGRKRILMAAMKKAAAVAYIVENAATLAAKDEWDDIKTKLQDRGNLDAIIRWAGKADGYGDVRLWVSLLPGPPNGWQPQDRNVYESVVRYGDVYVPADRELVDSKTGRIPPEKIDAPVLGANSEHSTLEYLREVGSGPSRTCELLGVEFRKAMAIASRRVLTEMRSLK